MLGVQPNSQFDAVLAAFKKANPNIALTYSQVPYTDLATVIPARVGTKTGDPNFFTVDTGTIPGLSARGEIADITEDFNDVTGLFLPAALKTGQYKGKLWSVPLVDCRI